MARREFNSRTGREYVLGFDKFSAPDQEFLAQWKPAGGAPVGATGDWFQWRGPNRDGLSGETGLKDDWTSNPPEKIWSATGFGKGYSSVVISNDQIFTLGFKDGETHIICAKVDGGDEIWSAPIGRGGEPTATPTVDPEAGLVFGVTNKGGGTLAAVNVSNGELAWSTNYESDFGGKMMSQWGYSESPLIDGDHVICTPGADDALLAALDKRTGDPVWKTRAPDGELGNAGKAGAGYGSSL